MSDESEHEWLLAYYPLHMSELNLSGVRWKLKWSSALFSYVWVKVNPPTPPPPDSTPPNDDTTGVNAGESGEIG